VGLPNPERLRGFGDLQIASCRVTDDGVMTASIEGRCARKQFTKDALWQHIEDCLRAVRRMK
jgi:hypothetical protein